MSMPILLIEEEEETNLEVFASLQQDDSLILTVIKDRMLIPKLATSEATLIISLHHNRKYLKKYKGTVIFKICNKGNHFALNCWNKFLTTLIKQKRFPKLWLLWL